MDPQVQSFVNVLQKSICDLGIEVGSAPVSDHRNRLVHGLPGLNDPIDHADGRRRRLVRGEQACAYDGNRECS